MKAGYRSIALISILTIGASVASATTFILDYTTMGSDTAHMTLFTTALGGGQFHVDSIAGVRDGLNVSLIPGGPVSVLSPDGLFIFDNLIHAPAAPQYFDYSGLMFTAGGHEYNLYGNLTPGNLGSDYTEYAAIPSGGYTGNQSLSSISLSTVPTPAAFLPFLTGLVGLVRRRRA